MKYWIEKIIRLRNPDFQFDEGVGSRLLFALMWEKSSCFLRGLKVLFWFKRPSMIFLGRGVSFFHVANMRWGRWVQIGEGARLGAMGKGQLRIGNRVSIGAFSRVIISTSFNHLGEHIHIGHRVGIGEFAHLGGGGGLEIGDDCIIGAYLSCHPENHLFEDSTKLIRQQGVSRKGIKIGKNCWIGAKVTILDGVIIGDHCVIAAGAVVTKSMPPRSVVGGVPAKVIKVIAEQEQEQGEYVGAS